MEEGLQILVYIVTVAQEGALILFSVSERQTMLLNAETAFYILKGKGGPFKKPKVWLIVHGIHTVLVDTSFDPPLSN